MHEYAPWAEKTLERILDNSSITLPILDVQLGGHCNLRCKYCDTPRYCASCMLDVNAIEKIISSGSIEWVYICGLGEPTAVGNIHFFKKILSISKKHSVKVSAFSNVVNLDDEILEYISDGTLYVLFKLDTCNRGKMKFLYGADKYHELIHNYGKLLNVVNIENNTTNLGSSIVPTKVNKSDVYKNIDFSMENRIFPLLGQLEKAGCCLEFFEQLKLDESELLEYKKYMKEKYLVDYKIPICPATISAIHVTNENDVIVDEKTGLSCSWFWLDEPKMIKIGNITEMSSEEITQRIIEYRKSKFEYVVSIEKTLKHNPFGGCGGDVKELFQKYIAIANY